VGNRCTSSRPGELGPGVTARDADLEEVVERGMDVAESSSDAMKVDSVEEGSVGARDGGCRRMRRKPDKPRLWSYSRSCVLLARGST
jgi:hypothetical protein